MDYDDYYSSNRKRKSSPSFGKMLFSAILGGGLVLFMVPYLIQHGWIQITLPQASIEASGAAGDRTAGQNEAVPAIAQVSSSDSTKASTAASNVPDANNSIVTAVDRVRSAVVGVINIQKSKSMFAADSNVETGMGSGIIFQKDGSRAKIVTNNHVIDGATDVEVALPSGERLSAKVLGADRITDLAVLEVDANDVKGVAVLGDSNQLRPGDSAIAIGNPLGLEFSQTVTVGVISSVERTIPIDFDEDGQYDWELNVLQTDAAINPGNSGGALVNRQGEVIGINSLKIADAGVEGLGFAIPMSDAKPIIESLMKYGRVKRPFIGITPKDIQSLTEVERTTTLKLPKTIGDGVVLVDVQGPALQAGLHRFDVVVRIDAERIHSAAQLRKYLYSQKSIGDQVSVSFYRNGQLQTVMLQLVEMQKGQE